MNLQENIPRLPHTAQIDHAVAYVFEIMLCQPCTQIGQTPTEVQRRAPGISATILISGTIEGKCAVYLSTTSAAQFTALLLGPDVNWNLHNTDEAVIDDAVRELCNMIAGGWKSRLGTLASACQISVPAIAHAAPHPRPDDPNVIHRRYAFAGWFFEVMLALSSEPSSE